MCICLLVCVICKFCGYHIKASKYIYVCLPKRTKHVFHSLLIIQAPLAALYNGNRKSSFLFRVKLPGQPGQRSRQQRLISHLGQAIVTAHTHTVDWPQSHLQLGVAAHLLAIYLGRCIKLMTHNLSQCRPQRTVVSFRLRLERAIEASAMNWPIEYR